MSQKTLSFLQKIAPFDALPQKEVADIAKNVRIAEYPADTLLCTQGKSKLDSLYVIEKGAVELFFEENGVKKLSGFSSEGETFGGIAMLVNQGFAIRTIRVHEPSRFFMIDRERFLALCEKYPDFSDFFTDSFGKKLLDKSYLAIVANVAAQHSDSEMPLYNQMVKTVTNFELSVYHQSASIQEVARAMNKLSHSAMLITDDDGKFVGIVTDKDFRQKVVADAMDVGHPVNEIMSSPLLSIPQDAPALEAILMMVQKNIKHLAVTDAAGKVVGMTSNRRLLMLQGLSPVMLMREIRYAQRPEDLFGKQKELAPIVKELVQGGARSDHLNRMITAVADGVLKKLIQFAIDEIGEPPTQFAFMILGSEGRKEQTLKTDQDNAIIYKNPPKSREKEVQDYFLKFGEKVCGWLNSAGYNYCNGNIMAQNPKWCQPVSVWKNYFYQWIQTPEPMAVMHSTIFFDFEGAYGDASLTRDLRNYLFDLLNKRAGMFYFHLVSNSLQIKPPLGFFRNFVVESKGDHKDMFDVKKAMTPIVDFARIYALEHKIEATNTLDRLEVLHQKNVLKIKEYSELEQAYRFLMQARLVRQVQAITEENAAPSNYINPEKLTQIEQRMLKEIFSLVQDYQEKMSVHFRGMM